MGGCEGGRLHQYYSKMLLNSSKCKNLKLFWFKYQGLGTLSSVTSITGESPSALKLSRFGSWHKVWFWGCKGFKGYALMILFWKLHNIGHTDHIWFTTPNIANGTILSHMWKFFILFIPLSTWMQGNWLCLNHFLRTHLPLIFQKIGIFRKTPRGRRSSTVNPLSAMTESPLSNGKFRNPDLVKIFLSEMWPV